MNDNGSRRRGVTLENAILDQAWMLVQTKGYEKLTMDEVAKAAKTNKHAIYRRWPQKCYLVMAAVSRHAPPINFEIEDHGSLSKDLEALFESLNPIFKITKPDDLRKLTLDMLSNVVSYELLNSINYENAIRQSIETILERAMHRNEISFSINMLSEKALNLPTLLIINEIILHGTLTETSIKDIISNILLPIYKA